MRTWPFRALLVDDVVDLRRLLRATLEGTGEFTIVGEAGNGEDAIAKARDLRPDVILLDLSMPKMDGLEALPKIIGASPSSKVVVLSGFSKPRLADSARLAGATLYLEKGIPPDELVDQLKTLLAGTGQR